MTDPIPAGTEHKFIPYLMVKGAAEAIAFYETAFGAEELFRFAMPDGTVGHAELDFDGALVYLSETPDDMTRELGLANPQVLGASSVLLHRYVPDTDAAYQRAIDAGATSVSEPSDEFYGDRAATVADPFGHVWALHTHVRDVSPEELAEAAGG